MPRKSSVSKKRDVVDRSSKMMTKILTIGFSHVSVIGDFDTCIFRDMVRVKA